ncbi:MAG: 3-oxoacyl-[acyl-carrier-protein] synthase 3 [Chlamydiae bacterium]|nr:3-oxoacyl-[acyl-carrier-protein] synthase 3 [Chlamydiota bacterium]
MSKDLRARITGMGSYLPERVLSNQDLEKIIDTSDEWITTRTGMKERRIAAEDEFSSDLAAKASKKALVDARIDPKEIDFILVATSTSDHIIPSTAALVQAKIGATNAAAMDIQAACTGYLYGLSVAKAYVESGIYQNVLLIGAEKMSAFVDYQDRNTCILFGDGASAAVVSSKGEGFAVDSICLGADGELAELIIVPGGGSRNPTSIDTVSKRQHYFKMAGRETFKHAVRRMTSAAKECLEKAGLKEEQISWLIPHQANLRIIYAMAKNFQIPAEKVGITIHKYGNTSASSLAITLDELTREQTINPGEHLLLVAFGAGLTWGASVLTKIEGDK